jgi:hypothetical protein
MGTFESIDNVKDAKTRVPAGEKLLDGAMGVRRCPNSECLKGVFVVRKGDDLVVSYPPEVLDIDTTNLPEQVLESLEEAVRCHSIGCYRAAAIMVRRTLEDVCAEQGATGDNLKDRIKALGSKAVLSQELLDGIDELRLLGNDAAHIDATAYNEVGKSEVELAIDVVKLLLLAVYQTAGVVDRLRQLKQQPSG